MILTLVLFLLRVLTNRAYVVLHATSVAPSNPILLWMEEVASQTIVDGTNILWQSWSGPACSHASKSANASVACNVHSRQQALEKGNVAVLRITASK